MANPILDGRMYARVTGIALAAVALLGILLNATGQENLLGENFLAFDWTHNIVHVVLAAVALYVGFMAPMNLITLYCKVFGIVYAGLGVVGFIPAVVDGLETALALHLEIGENLIHLVIGAWGIAAGFFGTATTTTMGTPPPTTMPPRKV